MAFKSCRSYTDTQTHNDPYSCIDQTCVKRANNTRARTDLGVGGVGLVLVVPQRHVEPSDGQRAAGPAQQTQPALGDAGQGAGGYPRGVQTHGDALHQTHAERRRRDGGVLYRDIVEYLTLIGRSRSQGVRCFTPCL